MPGMPSAADLLLYASAWVSLVAWATAEWRRARAPRAARLAFTLGFVALVLHSLAAFHARYGGSHALALADTARQTERATGRALGAGLYVNYGFLALWAVEVLLWWRAPASYRARPRALAWSVRVAFVFMFVNGAIVFAGGPVRALGVACVLAVLGAWYRDRGVEGADV